ncbi:MAG: VWA domain-containing protein [Saprospiraceae bacterium]|nr:VWA domain-containing protein [Saprospiraceae bacterium]MCZ2336639.1 VWA domain-containing protein [Chitinophagales bacterium]
MKQKHQVHNLIILDESGSMDPIKDTIISGFNELVQTIQGIEKQFPDQEHFISFISFNSLGTKLFHLIDPVSKLEEINADDYNPNSCTPLYDAMGYAITKLRQILQGKKDYNVLVTVLTDGEENDSKEFSGNDIKKLIEKLKMERWTFTYIGTDHDVDKVATSLSINNTMIFEKSGYGVKEMFAKEARARRSYGEKLDLNLDTSSNFYEDEEE